jgi:metal-sulfur cluster biosynthetic enzyme
MQTAYRTQAAANNSGNEAEDPPWDPSRISEEAKQKLGIG